MGKLARGFFNLSGNYEPLIAAPLDARTVVEFKSDLTNSTTWTVSGGVWVYSGLMVAVVADSDSNNGIYYLVDASAYTSEASWLKIADQRAIDALNKRIDQISGGGSGGAVQVENKAALPNVGSENTVYFVKSENATYRWDDTAVKYCCTGRDYEEIKVINGGDAAGIDGGEN